MKLGTIAPADIVRRDPGGMFFSMLRANYLAAAGAVFLCLLLLIVAIPNWCHLTLPPNAPLGVSYRTVVCWLIFVPVVWGFYAWQPHGIATLLRGLADRVPEGKSSHPELDRPLAAYQWHIWTIVGGAFALWELYWFSFGQGRFQTVGLWWQPGLGHPAVLHVAVIFIAAVTYYMVFLLVVRQCITVVALNSFFATERIEVLALHPDQCGGFRFIGDYAMAVAPLVAATGLNFSIVLDRVAHHESLGSVTAPVTLPLLGFLYVTLSVLFFVSPFWSAHWAMKAAKDERLMPLAEGYQRAQERVDRETSAGALDPKSVEQLETIRKARTLEDSIPTWPVHVSSVRNFSVALLSPAVPVALDLLKRALGLSSS